MKELEQNLALYFTGFSRTASEIAQEQLRMTPHKQRESNAMLQMVDEAESILSNPTRSVDDFGRLLNESWKLKRSLTQKISNASIDEIYQAGLGAGALGGKLLGAGGGGFMLFYVWPEQRAAVRARLKNLLCVSIKFSNHGSRVVVYEPDEVYDESLSEERTLAYADAV
jgi:D-glycero-alpha-D-manno-heptose-7-phosphate kinase